MSFRMGLAVLVLACAVGVMSADVFGLDIPYRNLAAFGLMIVGMVLMVTGLREGERHQRQLQEKSLRKDLAGAIGHFDHLNEEIVRLNRGLVDIDTRFLKNQQEHRNELVEEMRVIENLLTKIAAKDAKGSSTKAAPDKAKRMSFGADQAHDRNDISDTAGGEGTDEGLTLELIHNALRENRIDLYLQQIVSLPQRKVRFYEGFSILRGVGGVTYGPEEYLDAANEAGVMSDIDNLLLFRIVQLVRRMKDRNQHVPIFCKISANSMQDADFFPQFIDFIEHNSELADVVIFEFSQDAVDRCGVEQWGSLARLAELGFMFSMDEISTLDLDFAAMSRHAFRFLKVDADMLLSGSQQAGAQIHPQDLKEVLRRYGIDLIANGIDDEPTVVNVLEFELDYGQGALFGAPRPARDNLLPPVYEAETL